VLVAFDTETHLIEPGRGAPDLVCASVATETGANLLTKDEAERTFEKVLAPGTLLVGANLAYDLGVMVRCRPDLLPVIFEKGERGELYDIQHATSLYAIARGVLGKHPMTGGDLFSNGRITSAYSLENCVKIWLGRSDAKANDFWRFRYALLEGKPFDEWPWEARQYPVDDAENTREVALKQIRENIENLHRVSEETYTHFCLHLGGGIWGLRTDPVAVEALEERVTKIREKRLAHYQEMKWIRSNGSEDQAPVKRRVAEAYGATESCPECEGGRIYPPQRIGKSGKPLSRGNGKRCPECDGSALVLTSQIPRTDKGAIAKGRDVLVDSGDDVLADYAELSETAKIVGTYLPWLRQGVDRPILLRANTILETGRTSYSGPIQQLPRSGGVRECVVPRPGYVFSSCDYSGLELATHAQSCYWLLGHSHLGDVINAGGKPHDLLGARLLGIPYEEFLARRAAGDKQAGNARQAAKAGNFGFAGGMGAPKFVIAKRREPGMTTTAPDGTVYKGIRPCLLIGGEEVCGVEKLTEWKGRQYSPVCKRCTECAEDLRNAWFDQWPENRDYFAKVSQIVDTDGFMVCHKTGMIRGGVNFTQCANGFFQSLAAAGAKKAFRDLTRECYVVKDSPLYGSRPLIFMHDEAIMETPEYGASEAAMRLGEIMVSAMKVYVPDVKIEAEPCLMRRWYKGAEAVYDEDRRLIPWEPEKCTP